MKKLMNKMNERKGFTLAELLIVVAIIAVLVAVAIPVFTAQLEKSREATDIANLRSGYAEAVADLMTNGTSTGTAKDTYNVQQKQASWQTSNITTALPSELSSAASTLGTKTSGTFKVTVTQDASGSVSAALTTS